MRSVTLGFIVSFVIAAGLSTAFNGHRTFYIQTALASGPPEENRKIEVGGPDYNVCVDEDVTVTAQLYQANGEDLYKHADVTVTFTGVDTDNNTAETGDSGSASLTYTPTSGHKSIQVTADDYTFQGDPEEFTVVDLESLKPDDGKKVDTIKTGPDNDGDGQPDYDTDVWVVPVEEDEDPATSGAYVNINAAATPDVGPSELPDCWSLRKGEYGDPLPINDADGDNVDDNTGETTLLAKIDKTTPSATLVIAKTGESQKRLILKVVSLKLAFKVPDVMPTARIVDPPPLSKPIRIGVVTGDSIIFRALIRQFAPAASEDDIHWNGTLDSTGYEVLGSFPAIGNSRVKVSYAGPQRSVSITAKQVPPPDQATWATRHPSDASKAALAEDAASRWANANSSKLGGGPHNGPTDAARHAYWNALMASHISVVAADEAATSHEYTNITNGAPHNETAMDIENNAVGRSLAIIPNPPLNAPLQQAVMTALNNGQLTILDNWATQTSGGNYSGLLVPSP